MHETLQGLVILILGIPIASRRCCKLPEELVAPLFHGGIRSKGPHFTESQGPYLSQTVLEGPQITVIQSPTQFLVFLLAIRCQLVLPALKDKQNVKARP